MEKDSRFEEKNYEDEIDLKILIEFVLRNKIIIGTLAFISFLLASLYSLTLKKIWEGQFQIVLNSEKSSQISTVNSALDSFVGSNQSSNLKTQVGILESPSVLMPIYNLVNKNNINDLNNQPSFNNWKSNLDVELKQGTSILNIAYRDTNKEIILPALKQMSSIYQGYAKGNSEREDQLSRIYLINQIKLYKEKSTNSNKEAQNFAIDQNMSYDQNMVYLGEGISSEKTINKNSLDSKEIKSNQLFLGSIENTRVSAANKIREINLQIKKINELKPSDYESLQYFGSMIEALSNEGLPQKLKKIEGELIDLRSKFTEKDLSIIRLLEQRKLTINLLKSRAIKYLKIAKLEAESKMEAAMRPKGVLLKYRELRREAARDEKTLLKLENDLRMLDLKEAKEADPWQLITKPTLLKYPVGPSRRNIGLLGLSSGIFLGILLSFIKENKSDKIYTIKQIENLISTEIIEKINKNNNFNESKQITFLREFLKNQKENKITFLILEDINKSYLETLIDFLNKDEYLDKKIDLIYFKNNLDYCKNSEFIILCAALKYSSIKDIKDLNRRFKLLNKDFKGLIVLD